MFATALPETQRRALALLGKSKILEKRSYNFMTGNIENLKPILFRL